MVAVEDGRFYEHGGIDVQGIARALVKDVIKGKMAEGGSTITQQLIKNKYLSGEKTLDRKVKEGIMAIEFEQKYTKKQILEMYFNEIYFGNGAWGIAQAARLYFDKNPEELTDAECSLLAGVPKNPSRYNPLGKPAAVTGRRDVVLKRMVDLGMITPRRQKNLRSHPPTIVPSGQALQYLAHVRSKLIERYGAQVIEQGGLEVTASLDLNLQKLAEKTVREGVRRISPHLEGALVCLDPLTGDILAAVGGVDVTQSSYNRALFAKRQSLAVVRKTDPACRRMPSVEFLAPRGWLSGRCTLGSRSTHIPSAANVPPRTQKPPWKHYSCDETWTRRKRPAQGSYHTIRRPVFRHAKLQTNGPNPNHADGNRRV